MKRRVRKKRREWSPHRYLVAGARRVWRWSPHRLNIYKQAKEGRLYRCALCQKLREKIAADHIEPVGKQPRTWDEWPAYFRRLFEGKLQPLCKTCHNAKTQKERKERANEARDKTIN